MSVAATVLISLMSASMGVVSRALSALCGRSHEVCWVDCLVGLSWFAHISVKGTEESGS